MDVIEAHPDGEATDCLTAAAGGLRGTGKTRTTETGGFCVMQEPGA
jgi:hypothetical protein